MMSRFSGGPIVILMAEDDPADRLLTGKAFVNANLSMQLNTVNDGEELLDYLNRRGRFADPDQSPCPDLILLDLNMPKKDGQTVLTEIRAVPRLRAIPVVVLTTSKEQSDVARSYDLGANSFITKPATFDGLVETVRLLETYWFDIARTPRR